MQRGRGRPGPRGRGGDGGGSRGGGADLVGNLETERAHQLSPPCWRRVGIRGDCGVLVICDGGRAGPEILGARGGTKTVGP